MAIITPRNNYRGRIGGMTKAQLKTFVENNSSGGGVIVEESDGNPSVSPASKIKVSNGTLTDDGSGVVTINTAGPTGVITTKRLIIAASALTVHNTEQSILIYTKPANEGITNARVRWGATRFNWGGSHLYMDVGFKPSGGVLDSDTILDEGTISNESAGDWMHVEYNSAYGTAWAYGTNSHWRYQSTEMVHYGVAGEVYASFITPVGSYLDEIDEGTVEIWLDVLDAGDGTTIS